MTPEQLVPTLDLCQQLKAAGFPRDTMFVWTSRCGEPPEILSKGYAEDEWENGGGFMTLCAAPTAGELEEWLLCNGCDNILTKNESADGENAVGIRCNHSDGRDFEAHEATEIEAKAALVLEVAG